MGYANLLLHAENSTHRRSMTRVALDLAARFESHLTAVHIQIPQYHDYVPAGSYPVRPSRETAAQVRAESQKIDDQLRQEFNDRAEDAGFSNITWRFHPGEPAETHLADTLVLYAQSADLVIMHKHEVLDRDSQTSYETPALVALESSRAVLVLPHTETDPLAVSRVMIGWNGSIESVRAVTAALPFARQAEHVELIDVRDGSDDQSEVEEPAAAAEIRHYLAHHGVNAVYQPVCRGSLSVSEALQSQAAESGADLLVVGAYGHSRLRELMFGGVTFELIRTMNIPTVLVG